MNGGNQQQNGNVIPATSSFGFGNFNGGSTNNGGNFGVKSQAGNSSFGFGNTGGNGFSFGTGNKSPTVGGGFGNGFGGPAVSASNTIFGSFGANLGNSNTMNSQTQSAFNFNTNNTSNTFTQNNTNFTPNNAFVSQNQFNPQKPNNVFTNQTAVTGTPFGNNNNVVVNTSNPMGNGMNPVNGNGFSFGNQSHQSNQNNGIPQTIGNNCFGQNNNFNEVNQNTQIPNQGVSSGMFGPAIPQFAPQYIPNTLNVPSNNYSNQSLSLGTDLQHQSMLINSFLGSDLFRSMLANHKV